MKVLVSLSRSKVKPLSEKEFRKLSLSQKERYLKAYPNSSHAQFMPKRKPKAKNSDKHSSVTKTTKKAVKIKIKNAGRKVKDTAQQSKIANAIFTDVKFKLNDITKAIRSPKEDIVAALNEPSTAKLFKAAGGTVGGLSKAALEVLKLPNTALGATFKELHKTGAFQKLEKGTVKVDAFLKKHPTLKKVGGGLMAGAMIYQWMNMSFSGDFDDDFNIDHISEALQGNYSISDFLGSPSGTKAMAQLAAGIATGGLASFPWASGMNIGFAAVYTAAKKLGDKDLMSKSHAALKKAAKDFKKATTDTKGRK